MIQDKSWEITDSFWEKVKGTIPEPERDPEKKYKRAKGGGRKPKDKRLILAAIFYVLRTGIQWCALPKEFGSKSSVHRYFMKWSKAGVFQEMWVLGLEQYDEMKGIQWEWQSIDSSNVKSPLGKESVGPNPTDRGKNGSKRHVLVDKRGVPLSIVLTGANRHDVTQLETVLDSIVIARPDYDHKKMPTEHLCADKGYFGEPALKSIVLRGYIPHVVSRSEEKQELEDNPVFEAKRWVVERVFSWLNNFRKILVRYEKYSFTYIGLLQLACAFIAFRQVKVI